MDLGIALENIIRLITDITFIPFAVGFVVVVTQIIKNVLKLEGSRAAVVSVTVQVLVWAAYSFFKARGLDGQFEDGIKGLETILTTLATVLLPALLSGLASKQVYDKATQKQAAGFRTVSKPKSAA